MLKNRMVIRKIKNIIVLLMVMLLMFGAYKNIRSSKAENVIEISMEVIDKDNVLTNEFVTAEATEMGEGVFVLKFPTSVNGKVATEFFASPREQTNLNSGDNGAGLLLTEEEVSNKQIQVEAIYDKKEVTVEGKEEPQTLYKKELKYNDEVVITGYMPLNTMLEIEGIGLNTLKEVELPNKNQEIKSAYDLTILELIEKNIEPQIDENSKENETLNEGELENNETDEIKDESIEEKQEEKIKQEAQVETETVEYKPSAYKEPVQIEIKDKNNGNNIKIYNLKDEKIAQEIESTETEEGRIFTTDVIEKYLVGVDIEDTTGDMIESEKENIPVTEGDFDWTGVEDSENVMMGMDDESILAALGISVTFKKGTTTLTPSSNQIITNGNVTATITYTGGEVDDGDDSGSGSTWTWTYPGIGGGSSSGTKYRIQYKIGNAYTWTSIGSQMTGETGSATHTISTEGTTTIQFRVGKSTSSWGGESISGAVTSNTYTIIIDTTAPSAPTTMNLVYSNNQVHDRC